MDRILVTVGASHRGRPPLTLEALVVPNGGAHGETPLQLDMIGLIH